MYDYYDKTPRLRKSGAYECQVARNSAEDSTFIETILRKIVLQQSKLDLKTWI